MGLCVCVIHNLKMANLTEGGPQEVMADTLSCDLTGLPSFILQFLLGCIAFSTLISECRNYYPYWD